MWIPLIFAVLFVVGAVANTFGSDRNLAEAIAGYAIALCLFEIWRLLRRNVRQMYEFCAWLIENRDAVNSGTAEYNENPINEQTELTQYQLALSLVMVSARFPSRFYLVGQESTFYPASFFTLVSLILGWWGFPFGPIYTIGAVLSNLRGGKHRTVGNLLAELTAPQGDTLHEKDVVHLTERGAANARRIMSERGFPEGTALQVEVTGEPGFLEYSVTYDDLPPSDGSVWTTEANGVPVIVRKRDERRLAGLVVDFVDGEYTFKESSTSRDHFEL